MAQTKRVRLSRRARIVYRWLALLFAGLAIIGMLLPLMPGTVFAILAAWAASRSSLALNLKIRRNKYIGPMIHSWENGRTIPNTAKVIAIALFGLSLFKLWWFGAPGSLLIGMAILFTLLAGYLLSRPSPKAYAEQQLLEAEQALAASNDRQASSVDQ